jgi:hypothetical protein
MRVRTGDEVAIGGFIVTGTAPKRVLVRAIGPSLAESGIEGALADPVLELHGPGTFAPITNDNWRQAQEVEIFQTGIAPSNNLESAIIATLPPGAYTAIVRGNGGTFGTALVEVYDLDSGTQARLSNLSTRAFVSSGENILVAGFVLHGNNGDGRVVLRGLGPSLRASGMSRVLADPTLDLRDSNGMLVASDNDWQENSGQAAELAAMNLTPANPTESALVATLPAGAYTALLAGINNATGLGIVEVYDVSGAR